MYDGEPIPLADYPVQVAADRLELLDARTVYMFKNQTNTDGRWLAVCLCKSKFQRRDGTGGESNSVRIYRWRWRQGTKWNQEQRKRVPDGIYRWYQEQQTNLNKATIWEEIKEFVDEFMSKL